MLMNSSTNEKVLNYPFVSRVCDGDLLVNVILMLLQNMLSPVANMLSPVAAIAHEQVGSHDRLIVTLLQNMLFAVASLLYN